MSGELDERKTKFKTLVMSVVWTQLNKPCIVPM